MTYPHPCCPHSDPLHYNIQRQISRASDVASETDVVSIWRTSGFRTGRQVSESAQGATVSGFRDRSFSFSTRC